MALSPELYALRVAQAARAREAQARRRATRKRDEALAFIKATADSLPPLSEAQQADLAALLRGSEGDAA